MRWIFTLLLVALCGFTQALSSSGSRLLVVLEEASEKDKYSNFWGDLEARGFKLDFESPRSDGLSLFKHGERAYDHVLLLPPKSKAYGSALTPQLLLDYIKAEGNILLALSADTPTPAAINSLLLELDVSIPPDRHALVVDHFNYDANSAAEQHDVLLVSPPKPPRGDVKDFFSGDGVIAVPRAIGHVLGNASPLLTPILRAPSTAYSYNTKDEAEGVEELFASGEQLGLVSALQARNSARFTVLGSAEMLQDSWFDAKVKGSGGKTQITVNRRFAAQITEWTFKEVGVLRVDRLVHYLNEGAQGNSTLNPKIYRIKNDVTFEIDISEYSHDHWAPFLTPAEDALQLEFTMLSPFHRLPLLPSTSVSTSPNTTTFTTSFTLPDQHGIFNFRVNYKRPFLTNLDEKRQVTVRHFAHDEWPRSFAISGAWVWIAGIGVTAIGWLGFVALWLYGEPTEKRGGVKKTQ